MSRQQILGRIDELTEQHCRKCPDEPQRSKSSQKCRFGCAIGTEIHGLGAQMLQMSSDKRKAKKVEVKIDMAGKKTGPECGLTKKVFLEQIASGESASSIERAWGMKHQTLPYWVKVWGLKGIDANKAKAILDNWSEGDAAAPLLRSTSKPAQAVEHKPAGLPAINASKEAEQVKELASKLQERNTAYDRMLLQNKELHEKLAEQEKVNRDLAEDRDNWKGLYEHLHASLEHQTTQLAEIQDDRDHWKQIAAQITQDRDRAFEMVEELREERDRAEIVVDCDYEVVSAPPTFESAAAEIGALVTQKNAAYGDAVARTGEFLRLLFPDGIRPEQYADALCLVRIFDKQMRIANKKDAFGESPYRDIAGYGILGVVKLGGRIHEETV